jgi:hypothetical protein
VFLVVEGMAARADRGEFRAHGFGGDRLGGEAVPGLSLQHRFKIRLRQMASIALPTPVQ